MPYGQESSLVTRTLSNFFFFFFDHLDSVFLNKGLQEKGLIELNELQQCNGYQLIFEPGGIRMNKLKILSS